MRLPVRAPLPGAVGINLARLPGSSGPRPPLGPCTAAPGSPLRGLPWAGLTGSGRPCGLGPLPWPWRLGLGSGAASPCGLPYGLPMGRPCRAAWRLIMALTIGRAPANLGRAPLGGLAPLRAREASALGGPPLALNHGQQHGRAGCLGLWLSI